jgi:hypothetical protein
MSDAQLEREAVRLERELDKLDKACWPSVRAARIGLQDALDHVYAEIERRRT